MDEALRLRAESAAAGLLPEVLLASTDAAAAAAAAVVANAVALASVACDLSPASDMVLAAGAGAGAEVGAAGWACCWVVLRWAAAIFAVALFRPAMFVGSLVAEDGDDDVEEDVEVVEDAELVEGELDEGIAAVAAAASAAEVAAICDFGVARPPRLRCRLPSAGWAVDAAAVAAAGVAVRSWLAR